jgi:hypothetical protein
MKIQLLALLFTASCCANNNNQLQEELSAKQEQLSLLTEQIMKKDKLLAKISKKIKQHLISFKEKQKQQLADGLSDDDIYAICRAEASDFINKAYDVKYKQIDLLFDETLGGESARLFKFYLINCDYEYCFLQRLIAQWAALSDEILSIQRQLIESKD